MSSRSTLPSRDSHKRCTRFAGSSVVPLRSVAAQARGRPAKTAPRAVVRPCGSARSGHTRGGIVRKKRPYVAVLSELTITREGNEVIIAYNDPEIMITHLTVGPRLRTMTDQEILDLWNALLVA